MIIVSGTKRSGTSMWMQILQAAGFPVIGEAFPLQWRHNLKQANPRGFYESRLRNGIYYRTNPNPETGVFLFPGDVRRHAVKVFIPGLVRTDMAYIDHVIATIRPWREYVASVRRLQALEQAGRDPESKPFLYIHPALEWWAEMFALISDIATRRYAVHVQSYGGLLADTREVVTRVLGWLGCGEVEPAINVVDTSLRTQDGVVLEPSDVLPEGVGDIADELYLRLHASEPLSPSLLRQINAANRELQPAIRREFELVRQDRLRRKGQVATPTNGSEFDLMEGLE